tara:strand:+ start:73 stop:270 length:198 start_codon:yes stop_codon:yes gene_type:complete
MTSSEEKVNTKVKSSKLISKIDSKEEIINKAFKFHSEGDFLKAAEYYQLFIDRGFMDERIFSNYV